MDLVREFHRTFSLTINDHPSPISDELATVRRRLLAEETAELDEAMRGGDLAEIAQEIADVIYVAYGTAVSYGIDVDAVLGEVHRANMSKLGPDGQPVMQNGKVLKGPGYLPPDIQGVLT